MVGEDHFTYWDYRSLTRLFQAQGLVVVDHEIFGLERDFVKVIDGLRREREGDVPTGMNCGAEAGGWDVHPAVLAVETALNRVYQIVGGGVGIGLTLRRP